MHVLTLYNGLGGSNNSGGVDKVPHLNDNSTEYRLHASRYKDAHVTLNSENTI